MIYKLFFIFHSCLCCDQKFEIALKMSDITSSKRKAMSKRRKQHAESNYILILYFTILFVKFKTVSIQNRHHQ